MIRYTKVQHEEKLGAGRRGGAGLVRVSAGFVKVWAVTRPLVSLSHLLPHNWGKWGEDGKVTQASGLRLP